jgi:hypothetical protein
VPKFPAPTATQKLSVGQETLAKSYWGRAGAACWCHWAGGGVAGARRWAIWLALAAKGNEEAAANKPPIAAPPSRTARALGR